MSNPKPFPDLSQISLEKLLLNTTPDENGCLIWSNGQKRNRYGQICINNRGYLAHRIIAALAHGIPKDNSLALHSCDNPPCVNPEHLSWGNQSQNISEMYARNRNGGEKHGMAKLTTSEVIAIRKEYAQGITQLELAKKYNIDNTSISLMVRNKTWKNV